MKKGFTLSEVLVTLSILGIVAAITIPNIISHYKKGIVVNKLKIAYSILQNGIDISEIINGPATNWDYNLTNSEFASKYIYPYIKNSVINDSCTMKQLDGQVSNYLPRRYTLLSNGIAMSVVATQGYHRVPIFIDIDGPKKGSCTLGKDIFVFTIADKNYETRPENPSRGYKQSFFPGYAGPHDFKNPFLDYTLEQMMGTSMAGGCNKNGNSIAEIRIGSQCSAAIIKNNWKIPKDYPVKF